ncbi:MAG: DNA polymerase III subunit delta [bacterium]|nr:DNA polymerase III subunit delta [bacterium]
MPVKLLYGNDEYSIDLELKRIRKSVLDDDFADLNRKVLIEKPPKPLDIKDVLEVIETQPMMFGNLLAEIHTTSLFARGKTDSDKYMERLLNNLKTLNDNIYVVFVCVFPSDSDKKADSAKKLFKVIKEAGEVKEFNGFKFYETQKVIEWILKRAKEKKLILSNENAALLQSLVGSNLRTLDGELEKMKTYILPSNEITKEDILKLSQDNEDAFKVLDLWLKNEKYLLFEELDKLLIKDAPQKVIALFQTTVKRWLRIKLESEFSNADEIAKIIGAHPFFVKNEMIKLKDIDKSSLINLRIALNKAEYQMKSGDLKAELALETALVK